MKTLLIDWNDQKTKVYAETLDNGLWFHVNGKTYQYQEVGKPSAKRSQQKTAHPEQILATMPGKILKVNCNVGDHIQPGQSLVVLEAMKMEYNLKAELDGQIEAIHCTKGQQVQLGEELIKLKGN